MQDYRQLDVVGLTTAQIKCYETLHKDGSTTISNLAKANDLSIATTYRSVKLLTKLGFTRQLNSFAPQVTHYRAIRLDKALENLAIYQRRALRELIEEQTERSIKLQGNYGQTNDRDWR